MVEIKSLKFEDLSFSYENNRVLFDRATFEFPMNEIVWVQAENGAGRSTLLQLLASLLNPRSGAYIINGENVTDMTFEEFLPYRMKIGYGFDIGGVIHNRTLLENLTLPLLYHKVMDEGPAQRRAERYMDRMGIFKYRDLRPSFVPGGVRKMICLIRALIMHPQVLLLDDPTVGLGYETGLRYFDLISDLRGPGVLEHIFLSSFDDQFMGNLDYRKIAIDGGQIHLCPEGDVKRVVHL